LLLGARGGCGCCFSGCVFFGWGFCWFGFAAPLGFFQSLVPAQVNDIAAIAPA
jgi:hypothetical protein